MYLNLGLLSSPTFLNVEHYSTLYPDLGRKAGAYATIFACNAKKQIWSLTAPFPPNSRPSIEHDHMYCFSSFHVCCILLMFRISISGMIVTFDDKEKKKRLFQTIVSQTNSVAIGPLEYCGNGASILLPSGKKLCVFFLDWYN